MLCAAALVVALAGMVLAQDQQGPLKSSGDTVAKKKPADPNTPADGSLPKIPSEYKKDKMDLGSLQTFKADVDTVTVDVVRKAPPADTTAAAQRAAMAQQ